MSVYIFSNTTSSIKLVIMTYLVNNLSVKVFIEADSLIREKASLNLDHKKLAIGDIKLKVKIVFKTSDSFTDMHITV